MNKKDKRYLFALIITLIVVSFTLFYQFIFLNVDFAWYNDQQLQHNIFYEEWYRVIRETITNKRPSFYSWNAFLGTDFYVSKLMYCVGDFIITPVFIFAKKMPDLNYLLTFETAVCIVLSGILFYIFLHEFEIKDSRIKYLLSMIYSLSGFVVMYAGSYMFHRFYTLFPLMLNCTEKYRKNKKSTYQFSIVVALLFMQNYELMFSSSIFLILYYIFTFKLHTDLKFLDIIKSAYNLIIAYLLGILLCGIALVPLIYYLRTNPRVGGYIYDGFIWDFKTITSFISNLFCVSFNFRSDNPPYLFYTNEHYSSEFSIYATSIVLLSFILLIKKGNKKDKRTVIICELIILTFIIIKPLNSIIHAFSVPTLRWSFLLMIYHLIFSAYVFDNYIYDKSYKKIYIIIIILYLILLCIYYSQNFKYENISRYTLSIVILVMSSCVPLLLDYLVIKRYYLILALFTLLSLITPFQMMLKSTNRHQMPIQSFNQEYLDYFKDIDEDEMYRIYFSSLDIQPFNYLNLNSSLKYDYMSTTTYDSTYNAMTDAFLKMNGYESWIIDINDENLLKMLGVKYVGILNENEMNIKNVTYSHNLDDLKMYKLNDYNSIGHTYTKYCEIEDYNENFDWNNTLIVSKNDLEFIKKHNIHELEKAQLYVQEYNRQYMKATLSVDGDAILMVSIPYSEGWNVYDQDGNKMNTINVQGGFMGLIVDRYTEELSFYYLTPGLKVGFVLSFVSFCIIVLKEIILKKYRNKLGELIYIISNTKK